MNKKYMKILFLILSLTLILISIYQISQTYSVFYSKLQGSSEMQVGRWDILVNNYQVTNGYSTNFIMNDLDFSTSPNVLQGKIAPGLTGSGEISIKPQDVDVSIRYDVFVDSSVIDNEMIEISALSVTNKTKELILTDENTYTGTILLSELTNNYEDVLGFNIVWINDDDNNPADTEVGTKISTAIMIPVEITFSQYLGENIEGI